MYRIIFSMFLFSCGGDNIEIKNFERCATDRYATYYAYEGKCFSGQCGLLGKYFFEMTLKKSTCQNKPVEKYSFEDYIATGNHPLRFLLSCGYNKVEIDETWGFEGTLRDGLRMQIYEGETANNIIFGEHIKKYIFHNVECEDTYTMTIKLVEVVS